MACSAVPPHCVSLAGWCSNPDSLPRRSTRSISSCISSARALGSMDSRRGTATGSGSSGSTSSMTYLWAGHLIRCVRLAGSLPAACMVVDAGASPAGLVLGHEVPAFCLQTCSMIMSGAGVLTVWPVATVAGLVGLSTQQVPRETAAAWRRRIWVAANQRVFLAYYFLVCLRARGYPRAAAAL